MSEIWILGATGRIGRAVAERLAVMAHPTVLVGRDAKRLRTIAASFGGQVRIVVAGSVDQILGELSRASPAVVINAIGPFAQTARPIAQACGRGVHYVDPSNELSSIVDVLGLHDIAARSDRTCVTGAGFGVLATESVVLRICDGHPPASSVRVDALAAVESEPGPIGDALAASIIDGIAGGGWRYADGKLVRARLFGDPETLTLPDGSRRMTAAAPSGELEAARRASGAGFAVAASGLVPTAPLLRAVLPPALNLLRIRTIREFTKRRIAAITIKPKAEDAAAPPKTSWAHARVEWTSEVRREGWLELGDAMVFTAAVVTEVAVRLARGEGRPGAFTPGSLFGFALASDVGGTFYD